MQTRVAAADRRSYFWPNGELLTPPYLPHIDGWQKHLLCEDTFAGPADWETVRGKLFGSQGSNCLLDSVADRAAIAERPVESNRKRSCCVIADRTSHADHTIDHVEKRVGKDVSTTSIEHYQPDRRGRAFDHLSESQRTYVLRLALLALELDACIYSGSDVAKRCQLATSSILGTRFVAAGAAVTAKVNDRWLPLIEVSHHFVDAHRPFRSHIEVVAACRHPEFALDLSALFIKRKVSTAHRIRREEEDDMSFRSRPRWVGYGDIKHGRSSEFDCRAVQAPPSLSFHNIYGTASAVSECSSRPVFFQLKNAVLESDIDCILRTGTGFCTRCRLHRQELCLVDREPLAPGSA